MYSLEELLEKLKDQRFGILAESNTYQLTVVAGNADVAVGDLFLLPSRRGKQRVYVFRTTQYANILNRSLEMSDIARNKLTMPDSYFIDAPPNKLRGIPPALGSSKTFPLQRLGRCAPPSLV